MSTRNSWTRLPAWAEYVLECFGAWGLGLMLATGWFASSEAIEIINPPIALWVCVCAVVAGVWVVQTERRVAFLAMSQINFIHLFAKIFLGTFPMMLIGFLIGIVTSWLIPGTSVAAFPTVAALAGTLAVPALAIMMCLRDAEPRGVVRLFWLVSLMIGREIWMHLVILVLPVDVAGLPTAEVATVVTWGASLPTMAYIVFGKRVFSRYFARYARPEAVLRGQPGRLRTLPLRPPRRAGRGGPENR